MMKFFSFLFLLLPFTALCQYNSFKTFGTTGFDEGHSIIRTIDSNVVSFGTIENSLGNTDACIFKYTTGLDSIWMRGFGTSMNDELKFGLQNSDGSFVVCGETMIDSVNSSVFVAKADENANVIWQKSFGGAKQDIAYSICNTLGGYLICGKTSSYGNGGYDMFLMKLNEQGDSLWFKTYGSTGDDQARNIINLNNGNMLVAGTFTKNNRPNGSLMEISSAGDTLWTKTYLQSHSTFGYSACISNSQYVLGGFAIDSSGTPTEIPFLIKTDISGNEIWRNATVVNGSYPEGAYIHSIKALSDGSIMATGTDHVEMVCRLSSSERKMQFGENAFLTSYNSSGDINWYKSIDFNNGSGEQGMDVLIFNDSTIFLTGFADDQFFKSYTNNILISRIDKSGNFYLSIKDYDKTSEIKIYPNPANTQCRVELPGLTEKLPHVEIYNCTGQLITDGIEILNQGNQKNELSLYTESLSPGLYFIKVNYGDQNRISKFIVQH